MSSKNTKYKIQQSTMAICVFMAIASIFGIKPNTTHASLFGVSSPTSKPTTGLYSGLVGHWTFDGKDVVNGVILDRSGNGNNGNPSGISTSTFYKAGKIGQAGNFDGVNDYVNIGDIDTLDNATSFTICAWVKQPSINTTNYIVAKNNASSDGIFFREENPALVSGRANVYTIVVADSADTDTARVESATNMAVSNIWTYVCATYVANSSTGLRLYINGAQDANSPVSTTAISAIDAGSNFLRIGNRTDNNGFFRGAIDDVRVYNRALSASEILQLYNEGATKFNVSVPAAKPTTGLYSGLVGYWTFDGKDVQNGVILDKSGNGNHGNPISIATSTFYTVGKIGQAGNFDGGNDYVTLPTAASVKGLNVATVSAWVNPDSFPTFGGIYNEFVSGSITTSRLSMFEFSEGNVFCSVRVPDGSSSLGGGFGAGTLKKGSWSHLVCVFDPVNNTIYEYLNGRLIISHTIASGNSPFDNTDPFGIRIGSGNNTLFDGKIDDVRVYNRALSAKEISQLYNEGATKFDVSIPAAKPTTGLYSGLVGHWTFDGKDVVNGVILDRSGNGNNGNPSGIASSTFYSIGKIGQAGNFDGGDDTVTMGDTLDLIGTELTVSAWFNPFSCRSNGGGVNKLGTAGNYRLIIASAACLVQFALKDSGGTTQNLNSQSSIQRNKWSHVVGTVNSNGNGVIYINGISNNTTDFTITRGDTSTVLNIGRNTNNATFFDGKIDDVRIYNRALSATEVMQLYNMGR
jgi:hypothetical protein